MTQQRHIIGRTVLELNTGQLADVWSLQEDMSRLLQQQGIPAMAQLFEQLVAADEVVRLDQVVVDLGVIHPQFIQDEFIPKLISAVNQTLRDYLANRLTTKTNSPILSQNRSAADWEILLYFLRYGRLPWWVEANNWQQWIPRWQAAIQNETTWQQPLREWLATNPQVRQRLVSQFPESFCHQLVLQLQPTWIDWSTLLTQGQQIIQALSLNQNGDRLQWAECHRFYEFLNTQAWLLLLAEIPQTSSSTRPLPKTVWIRNWLTILVQTWQQQATITPEASPNQSQITPTTPEPNESQTQLPDSGIYQRLRTILATIPTNSRTPWLTTLNQILPPAPETTTSTNLNDPLRKPQIPSALRNSISSPKATPESNNQHQQIDSQNNPQTSILSPEEEITGIYINQAGLVLLHPFLHIYLNDVALVDQESFRDESAQQTAIYLLHYLATRQTDAPEYELVLPKLLCGWPLNQAIACNIDLPTTALNEAEHLLQTAIDYWQALKNTSPDGLREGFLQREGKLTRNDNGAWKLQIERQSIDILLSRLPWGLNIVKFPWMEDMLIVDWI